MKDTRGIGNPFASLTAAQGHEFIPRASLPSRCSRCGFIEEVHDQWKAKELAEKRHRLIQQTYLAARVLLQGVKSNSEDARKIIIDRDNAIADLWSIQ